MTPNVGPLFFVFNHPEATQRLYHASATGIVPKTKRELSELPSIGIRYDCFNENRALEVDLYYR